MSLYALGSPEILDPTLPARADDLVSGDTHTCASFREFSGTISSFCCRFIANASGTGKTRLLSATLSRHWGLYFTFSLGTVLTTVGSSDLATAISSIKMQIVHGTGLHVPVAVGKRLSKASSEQLTNNRRVARAILERLLLARLLLFKRFLTACERLRIPEEDARYRWLLMQMRPDLVMSSDPFQSVFLQIEHDSDASISTRLEAALKDCDQKISVIAVDEVHVGMAKFKTAFATGDHEAHAPIFRELVTCLGDHFPKKRFAFSGHRLDLDLVTDALRYSDAENKSLRHVYDFGTVDSLQRCSDLVRHFFADGISEDDCRTIYTWLRGR